MMRTLPGKMELAQWLTDPARAWPDAPLTRQQAVTFLETGRLAPLWRADRSEALAIKEEGEALTRGEPVVVMATDHHANHIREHKAILDGRARLELDPQIVASIGAHIAEHGSAWVELTMSNPALLMATGQQPAPMALGMMPGAPMPGGGPPAEGGAMGAAPEAADPPPTGPAAAGSPTAAKMPTMPTNPATGERASVPGAAPVPAA
jgi:hypothetical protein